MAKYGAKYIRWAPFANTNPEPDDGVPNYGAAVSLSKLVKVTDNPTFTEGKFFADNELAEYTSEFSELGVDIEISDMANDNAAVIFGATSEESTGLDYTVNDTAPYGGLGFVSQKQVDGVKSFVGIFYPKLKATPQGEEYDTKGDSINYSAAKVKFIGKACNSGLWKRISPPHSTFAAAKTWLDGQFTAQGT